MGMNKEIVLVSGSMTFIFMEVCLHLNVGPLSAATKVTKTDIEVHVLDHALGIIMCHLNTYIYGRVPRRLLQELPALSGSPKHQAPIADMEGDQESDQEVAEGTRCVARE